MRWFGRTVAALNGCLEKRALSGSGLSPRRLHVLAHSLGNQVARLGLEWLQGDATGCPTSNGVGQPMLGELMLASADVGVSEFKDATRRVLARSARAITHYFSPKDLGLRLNTFFLHNGDTRIGQVAPLAGSCHRVYTWRTHRCLRCPQQQEVTFGISAGDVGPWDCVRTLPTTWLSSRHTDFLEQAWCRRDLHLLFSHGKSPDQRATVCRLRGDKNRVTFTIKCGACGYGVVCAG